MLKTLFLTGRKNARVDRREEELNKHLPDEEEDADDIKSRSIDERVQARAECVRAEFVFEDAHNEQRATFENSAQAQAWVQTIVDAAVSWETTISYAFSWARSRAATTPREGAGSTWIPLN